MLDWLAERWNAFVNFSWQLVLSLLDLLKDFFFWCLETLMDVGLFLLDGVGAMMEGLDIAKYFTMLPPEALYMLKITGFSEAMGMIVTCIGIRFVIQMIPFVRWGS